MYFLTEFHKVTLRDQLLLIMAILISRWCFRSDYLFHMDSINFALGMEHFDPFIHQPHPPGYYLYIKLGNLMQIFFPNPNDALVAIAIIASCVTATMIYQLGYEWFGRSAARWAGFLFIFSPLAWAHGTVALIYMLETGVVTLIGYLCWNIYRGNHNLIILLAVLLGLLAGIRQSTVIFMAPLVFFTLAHAGWRYTIKAITIGIFVVILWFVPMLIETGGIEDYFTALNNLLDRISESPETTVPFVPRALIVVLAYLLCFVSAAPLFFFPGIKTIYPSGLLLFLLIWILPALLFFIFIFINPSVWGYTLFLFVPFFVLLGARIATLLVIDTSWKSQPIIIFLIVILHSGVFLFSPVYFSFMTINKNGVILKSISEEIRLTTAPKDTVIVALDTSFFGFRQLGYELPEYQVLSLTNMIYPREIEILSMHNRSTQILSELPKNQYSNFVFITPKRHIYERYYAVLKSNNESELFTKSFQDMIFTIKAPISVLDKLFSLPETSKAGI